MCMNFTGSTKNYFTKWNDFSSRISRSEYWWGYLGIILISLVFGFIVGFTLAIMGASEGQINLAILPFQLFTIIASISLVARRLHDADRSGWWQLLSLTIIGIIPVFYWLCKKGDEEDNRFGADPLL